MSKKTCFMIFIIAFAVIMTAYVFNLYFITREVNAVFSNMQNRYIALSSVILSLLLLKNKHYWLIMFGVALVAVIIIQALIMGQTLMSIALLYKLLAFIVYTYFIALIRYML